MSTINVQFSDSTKSIIVAYFASPQDPDIWENLGEVDTSDARWKAYFDKQDASLQQKLPTPS
jgi:hypothetical protein